MKITVLIFICLIGFCVFGQDLTDAKINEIQEDFLKISVRDYQALAEKAVHMSEEEIMHLNFGVQALNQEKKDFFRFLVKNELAKLGKRKIAYWKNNPEVQVVPSYDKIYTIKPGDTLDFSMGPSKNLAMIKEENKIILVKSFSTDEASLTGNVRQYGYTLVVYELLDDNSLKEIKKVSIEKKFEKYGRISINQFKTCAAGYILVGPDMYFIFDKNYNVLKEKSNVLKSNGRLYMDVDQLEKSDNFVVLYGESTHNPGQNSFSINTEIISIKSGEKLKGSEKKITTLSSDIPIKYPTISRVFGTSENEYACMFFDQESTFLVKNKYQNNRIEQYWYHQFFQSRAINYKEIGQNRISIL